MTSLELVVLQRSRRPNETQECDSVIFLELNFSWHEDDVDSLIRVDENPNLR